LNASFEAPAYQLIVSIPKALGGEISETNRHLAGLDGRLVVLLFGYHTSTDKTSSAATASSTSGSTASGGSQPSSSPTSSSSGSNGDGSSKIATYTGSVAQTRWGPVQVKIAVQSGKITKVTVLQQPNGNQKDAEINSYALPILIDETVQTQSADIDMVSGATVTSEGYAESLQGALDEAGI
jgi:uncharacterized protein with FMN-binding domain